MYEIVTESNHAQCELCKELKNVKIIELSANQHGESWMTSTYTKTNEQNIFMFMRGQIVCLFFSLFVFSKSFRIDGTPVRLLVAETFPHTSVCITVVYVGVNLCVGVCVCVWVGVRMDNVTEGRTTTAETQKPHHTKNCLDLGQSQCKWFS